MDIKTDANNQKLNTSCLDLCPFYFKPVVFSAKSISYGGEKVYPKERCEEINECKNQTLKNEKYSVWKLLESAVNGHIGVDFNKLDLKKSLNGRWECADFYFSLSHSDGLVAVALSPQPVGVDVQKIKEVNEGLADRILTETEKNIYRGLNGSEKQEYLIKTWAKKECILKSLGENALLPSTRETIFREFFETVKTYEEQSYYLCAYGNGVSAQTPIIEIEL